MARPVVVAALMAIAVPAHADVFAFKDLGGFEKCMRLDHLLESVDTATGKQARVLGPAEIQARCLEAAARLVAQKRDRGEALAFVAAAKKLAAWPSAIELAGASADVAIATCNELAIYEVITSALERPRSEGFLPRAKLVVRRCLKDAAFRSDFLEEQSSGDKTLREHACEILREEKLVKQCRGGKP